MDSMLTPLVIAVSVAFTMMNVILLGIYTELKKYGQAKANFFQFEIDERSNCV